MKEVALEGSPSDDRNPDDLSSQAEEVTSNPDNPDEASDISDNRDDNSEVLNVDLEDRESSPVNWETDASETRGIVPEGGDVQNEQSGKRASFVDDSSSTCSSDSVPSVILNGSNTGGAWTNVKSSSNRYNFILLLLIFIIWYGIYHALFCDSEGTTGGIRILICEQGMHMVDQIQHPMAVMDLATQRT